MESLTLPNPPPPLRFPRNEHNFTVQVFWDSDIGYCVEEVDNPEGRVQQLKLPRDARIETRERGDLFDGVVTLTAAARRVEDRGWGDSLYRNAPPAVADCRLTALRYFLWNNRTKGSMQIWLLES